MTTLSEELCRLEEARERATKGPWLSEPMAETEHGWKKDKGSSAYSISSEDGTSVADACTENGHSVVVEDATFIVLAKNCPVNFRKLAELVEAQSEYIALLESACGQSAVFMHVHGMSAEQADIDKGVELRARIKALSSLEQPHE